MRSCGVMHASEEARNATSSVRQWSQSVSMCPHALFERQADFKASTHRESRYHFTLFYPVSGVPDVSRVGNQLRKRNSPPDQRAEWEIVHDTTASKGVLIKSLVAPGCPDTERFGFQLGLKTLLLVLVLGDGSIYHERASVCGQQEGCMI